MTPTHPFTSTFHTPIPELPKPAQSSKLLWLYNFLVVHPPLMQLWDDTHSRPGHIWSLAGTLMVQCLPPLMLAFAAAPGIDLKGEGNHEAGGTRVVGSLRIEPQGCLHPGGKLRGWEQSRSSSSFHSPLRPWCPELCPPGLTVAVAVVLCSFRPVTGQISTPALANYKPGAAASMEYFEGRREGHPFLNSKVAPKHVFTVLLTVIKIIL
jgi:hypothetical protein